MLTPEEQAYQNSLLSDGGAKAAYKEHVQPNTQDWEQYAKSVGVDTEKIKKEVDTMDAQDLANQIGPDGKPMATQGDLGGAVKGAAQGIADVTQNVLNFGIDVADGIENFAADHGLGKGDIINDSSRIDWSSKLGSPEDSIATRAVREITKYAAPVVATMATGGGALMGLGVGAAADILTLDPKQQRLSSILREQVPELKNYPAVYGIINTLANNPGDTNLQGRLKNMVEGLGIAAPIAGVFSAIAHGAATLGKGASKAVAGAAEAGAPAASVVASVETGAAKADAQIASEAALAANEAKISPPTGPLYDYAPMTPTGEFNLNNGDVVDFAKQYALAHPQDINLLVRGPRRSEELAAEVAKFKKDPEALKSLLGWKLGDRPLTDIETKVAQSLMGDSFDSVSKAGTQAATTQAPEDLLHLSEMLDTFKHINNVESAAGSEAARALNANKIGADLMNLSVDEFNKILDGKSRAELLKNVLDAHGGKDNILEMAQHIKAIGELPNGAAAQREALMEAAKRTGLQKTADIIKSVAINGMLSSPKTVMANSVSNAFTTANSIMENYVAAGLGTLRGTADGVHMADANGYVRGIMSSLLEGVSAAGQALKTGKGGPANIIKGDLVQPLTAISAEGLGIPIERSLGYKILGKIVDATGLAVGMPTRINATADGFFGTIMYRGKQYERAVSEAEKAGLKGKEAAMYIEQRVSKVTVADHEANSAFAQENTFSQALEPGSFGKSVDNVIDKLPMGRVVFPFFKTNANIIDYSFQHSPLAVFSGPIRESIIRGGKEGDIAAAKVVLGSSLLGAAAYLASQGVVTGPDTRNPRAKQALEESGSGWQPDSIKIGDHYVSYNRIDPFNSFMRLGAVMSSLRNYVADDEYQQLASIAGGAVSDFMTPEMMVDGYSKFFDAYNEAARYDSKDKVVSVMSDIAARFVPFSALQRDVKNMSDPYKASSAIATKDEGWLNKFTDKIIARYQSQSPFYSKDLPIQRNMFGEPLLVPDGLGPDMISPFTITKVGGTELVAKLGKLSGFKDQMAPDNPEYPAMQLAMPSKTFTLHGVSMELGPQEYEKYVMYSAGLNPDTGAALFGEAGTLRSVLDKELKALGNVPDEMSPREYNKYTGVINKTILKFRQMGNAQMLKDPQIMDRFKKAVDATNQKQTVDMFQ